MTVVRFNGFATFNFHVLRIFLVIYFSHYVPLSRSFSYNLETCKTHSKVTWVTILSIFCRSHILSVILLYRNHTASSIHGLSFCPDLFRPFETWYTCNLAIGLFRQVLLDAATSKHYISTSYDCVYATYSDVWSAFDLLPMESGSKDDSTQGRTSIGELSSIIF